jgi:hypothetical protein
MNGGFFQQIWEISCLGLQKSKNLDYSVPAMEGRSSPPHLSIGGEQYGAKHRSAGHTEASRGNRGRPKGRAVLHTNRFQAQDIGDDGRQARTEGWLDEVTESAGPTCGREDRMNTRLFKVPLRDSQMVYFVLASCPLEAASQASKVAPSDMEINEQGITEVWGIVTLENHRTGCVDSYRPVDPANRDWFMGRAA